VAPVHASQLHQGTHRRSCGARDCFHEADSSDVRTWDRHGQHGGSEPTRKTTGMYRFAEDGAAHKGYAKIPANLTVG
jgi:hypothetical protein